MLSNALSNTSAAMLIPPQIALIYYRVQQQKYQWDLTCKVTFSLSTVPVSVNCLTLMAIACERFYAIFYPLRSRMYITVRKMQLIGLLTWTPVLIGLPFIMYSLGTDREDNISNFKWSCSQSDALNSQEEFFTVMVILFFLASSITFICYIAIGCLLCYRSRVGISSNTNPGVLLEKRTCVVLCASMLSYYVLYLPVLITHNLDAGETQRFVAIIILHINFFVNPIIYTFHPGFNIAYRKMLGFSGTSVNNVRSACSHISAQYQ